MHNPQPLARMSKKSIYNTSEDFSSDFQFDVDEDFNGPSSISANLGGIQTGVIANIRKGKEQSRQKSALLVKSNTQPHLKSNALQKAQQMLKGGKDKESTVGHYSGISKRNSAAKFKLDLELNSDDELENYYKSLKKKATALKSEEHENKDGTENTSNTGGASEYLKPTKIVKEETVSPVGDRTPGERKPEIGESVSEDDFSEVLPQTMADLTGNAYPEEEERSEMEINSVNSDVGGSDFIDNVDDNVNDLSLEELGDVNTLLGKTRFISDLETSSVDEVDEEISEKVTPFNFKTVDDISEHSSSVHSDVKEESEIATLVKTSEDPPTPASSTSSVAEVVPDDGEDEPVQDNQYSSDYTSVTSSESSTTSTSLPSQSKSSKSSRSKRQHFAHHRKRNYRGKEHDASTQTLPYQASQTEINQSILASILHRPLDVSQRPPIAPSILGADVLEGKSEREDYIDGVMSMFSSHSYFLISYSADLVQPQRRDSKRSYEAASGPHQKLCRLCTLHIAVRAGELSYIQLHHLGRYAKGKCVPSIPLNVICRF